MKKIKAISLLALSAAAVSPAVAAISYIDATPANTTGLPPADGSTVNGWQGRGAGLGQGTSNFGNEGGTYQAASNEASTTDLTTTIVLPAGLHDVYVFFWDDDAAANAWDIKAGITGSPLTAYSSVSGAFKIDAASQAVPATAVTGLNVLGQGADDYTDYVDGNRELYAALVGSGLSGTVSIDIDANDATTQRTWYDGVGTAAIPEPSVALLGMVGLLALVRRRR